MTKKGNLSLNYDVIDERELKIERQKKKNMKLKLTNTKKWLIMALIFFFDLYALVLGTLLICKTTSIWSGFYLKYPMGVCLVVVSLVM